MLLITASFMSGLAIIGTPVKSDIQYNLYVPNPYGDGIGAPHNVTTFTDETGQTVYEWTLVHGD